MLRVYISSTDEDLVKERRAARDSVHDLGHYAVGMESYGASNERALDRCLRDVRSCQAYVGIFAWRYGFRPNAGEKSITQLEYEEAQSSDIPCLIFMLHEDASWPRSRVVDDEQGRIEAFRELLKMNHIINYFQDATDLALKVTRSLANSEIHKINRASMRLDLDFLAHLCDRSDQEFALKNAVEKWNTKPDHPLVCIVHGEDAEAHDKFCDRLRRCMLPLLFPVQTRQSGVQLFHLEWPASIRNVQEMHRRFEWSLSKQVLKSMSGSCEAVNRKLCQIRGPVAIHAHLITENWQQEINVIDAFVDFWCMWPRLAVGQLLLAFLFIKYHGKEARHSQANDEMRAAVDKYDPDRCAPLTARTLPKLRGLTLGEAEDWALSQEISQHFDSHNLIGEIRDYFVEWELHHKSNAVPIRIPTEQLVPKLKEMMSRWRLCREQIV
jgi:hypothetical protein